MMKDGQYTTEESMKALQMTVEEIEDMEANPEKYRDEDNLPLPMGKYGSLFLKYLRENYPGRHAFLLGETTLRDTCAEVDKEAKDMMETVQSQLRAKKPKPATGDFMEMVRYNTTIRDQAEEIVLNEIVYKPR